MKFFIIDDDEITIDIQTDFLEDAGHTVSHETVSENAFARVKAERPDCVITDLMMPGIDGYQMLKQIRESEGLKDVKVIVVSSKAFEYDQKQVLELGADGFISKPVSSESYLTAIDAIIKDRRTHGPFTSLIEFCERVDLRSVNRPTIEALIKSGAFDSMHGIEQRACMFAAVGDAITAGQTAADDRRRGQMNFFEAASAPTKTERPIPAVEPWERMQTLIFEKQALGFHVSGHPLDLYEQRLKRFRSHDVSTAARKPDKTAVKLAGVLGQVRTRTVQRGRSAGQKMALAPFSDKTGSIDVVLFSDAYTKYGGLMHIDAIVGLVGRLDRARGEPNLIVDQVIAVEDLDRQIATRLELELVESEGDESLASVMPRLEQTLRDASGNGGRAIDVLLHVHSGDQRVALKPSRLRVVPETELMDQLKQMLGAEHVRLVSAGP